MYRSQSSFTEIRMQIQIPNEQGSCDNGKEMFPKMAKKKIEAQKGTRSHMGDTTYQDYEALQY